MEQEPFLAVEKDKVEQGSRDSKTAMRALWKVLYGYQRLPLKSGTEFL